MRALMWFTIGFGIVCGFGAYCYRPWFALLFLVPTLVLLFGCIFRKRLKGFRIMASICVGAMVAVVWFGGYHHFYLGPAERADGSTQMVTAEAIDYSKDSHYGSTVESRIQLEGRSFRAIVYLNEYRSVKPGEHITGSFRLRLTHEGLEGDTYHRGNGIFLLAYPEGRLQYTNTDEVPLKYFPAVIRREILSRLELIFPEDVAFFPKALFLGDRTDVDYQTNTAFKVSGISHIIAVSGLHISILFSMITMYIGRRRLLTPLLTIPVLLLFSAVAGFTPSITRACVMQILLTISIAVDREEDSPTGLSASVLLMLMINPIVITSASFQLSVGCMVGIIMFSERIRDYIAHLLFWNNWQARSFRGQIRHWISSGTAATLSAMIFTTPLVAYYFGCVSLAGIITNLLTLWVVTLIFYGIVIVCILSLFWHQAAVLVAWLFSYPIRYVLVVAKLLSSIPLAAVYTKSVYIILWIVFVYGLVAVFLLKERRRPFVMTSCAVLGLVMALLCSWIEPMLSSNRMTVLDVGQGQCILLQSKGKTFVVDCGGDSDDEAADQAAETLLSMGIYRIDGLILTHYDTDHAGGVSNLLYRVPADAVYLPLGVEEDQIHRQILSQWEERCVYVSEDLQLSWDDTIIRIFAPISDHSDNESGLCVLFQGENCDILITGDLSTGGENRLVLQKNIPKLTAFVAGHHGAASSTGTGLLAATEPEYVFVSVGEDNPYGHPHDDLLERLRRYGCKVFRTDLQGSIVFRR